MSTPPARKAIKMSITRRKTDGPIGAKTGLKARVYPNGEAVVYKVKSFKPDAIPPVFEHDTTSLFSCCMRAYGTVSLALLAGLVPLGSSPLSNFDKPEESVLSGDDLRSQPQKRKGLMGITSFGARMVRNGCYLIETESGPGRVVFATCTIPDLSFEDMARVHNSFHHVVEIYRLNLRRLLKEKGLSGESVTVSEIQTGRYEKTGLPVLHIHSVFCGKTSSGKWAVSKAEHDEMWLKALGVVLKDVEIDVKYACNLQVVKRSAEGYLGKYMSKGSKAVKEIVESGFTGWMPRQWWNCSRTLRRRIDEQTTNPDDLADWLNDMASCEGNTIWLWHRDVEIEMRSGETVVIARYGRLSAWQLEQIKRVYGKNRDISQHSA